MIFKTLKRFELECGKPLILEFSNSEIVIPHNITSEEILRILQIICDNSIYAFQNQICQGFITVRGGHRVGITGEVVIENEKVKNISYIHSLNFRVANQIDDASINVLQYILDIPNNNVYNTLIVGTPGTGKTTILKDLIKKISNGIDEIGFKRSISRRCR